MAINPQQPKPQDIQETRKPRRTRRYTRYLLERAIPHATPTGADPGWCYLNLGVRGYQQALSGLGRCPSPAKVLNAIDRLGAVLPPRQVKVHNGTAHVHDQ